MKANKQKRAKPGDPTARGVHCPKPDCGKATRVLYAKHGSDGAYTRRRICSCGHEFTTDEVAREKRNSVDRMLDSVDGTTLLEAIRNAKRMPTPNVPSLSARTP